MALFLTWPAVCLRRQAELQEKFDEDGYLNEAALSRFDSETNVACDHWINYLIES